MSVNVIGEAGVRIRPLTDGFESELAKVIKGGVLPLAIGGNAEAALSQLRSQAEQGVVLPLTANTKAADAAVGGVVASVETGAQLPVTASTKSAEQAVSTVISRVEEGVSLPVHLQADDATSQLARLNEQANQGRSAIGGLSDQLGSLQGQVSSIGQGFGGVVSGITGLLGSKGGLLLGGGLIGGALAAGNVLAAGQQRLTTIEDSVTALNIQLGSAAKSAKLVDNILQVVKGTPFTLDQFVEAGRTLVTFGVAAEKIPKYLTAIGEAAAGSGNGIAAVQTITDVFSKIQIAGRVTTDDYQRLGYAGVNALRILGNAMGKTEAEMQELVTKGAVPASTAIDQLIEGITNGSDGVAGKVNKLGGSMAALRKTFSGAAGGLQAASARLGVAFLEPFRESSVKLLTTFADALDALAPTVKKVLGALADTGIVDKFAAAVAKLPGLITDTISAFEKGGIGAALDSLFGAESGIGDKVAPIFERLGSIVESLKTIIQEAVKAATPLATIFGGAFLVGLQAITAILDPLLSALAQAGPVVTALATAIGGLVILKQFDPIEGILQRVIEGATGGAAAAKLDAKAQLEDAAATKINADAKFKLIGAQTAATAAAEKSALAEAAASAKKGTSLSALADAQREFITMNNLAVADSGFGPDQSGKELANLAEARSQAVGIGDNIRTAVSNGFDNSKTSISNFGSRISSSIKDGFSRAKSSITDFFDAFKLEAALAVGVFAFKLTTDLLKAEQEANAKKGAKGLQGVADQQLGDLQKSNGKIADVVSNRKKLFLDYTTGIVALNTQKSEALTRLNDIDGGDKNFVNAFRNVKGELDRVGRGIEEFFGVDPGKVPKGSAVDRLNEIERLNGLIDKADEKSKKLRAEFLEQTRGLGRLSVALGTAGNALEKLGAKKLSDPGQIAQNQQNVLETLKQRFYAQNGKNAGGDALKDLQEQAKVLGQYDLPTLDAALAAAGIDLKTFKGNASELAAALEDAAKKTKQAAAETVGLSKNVADVASAWEAAKKAGDAFSSLLFAQSNGWLSAIASQDAYSTSLGDLQYKTDFTASAMQNLANQAQSSVGSAYALAQANAELNGATDAGAQAARAGAAEEAKLREAYIQTAQKAGFSADEAQRLATAIYGVPGSVTVNIQINVLDEQLKALEAKLKQLQAEGGALSDVLGTKIEIGQNRIASAVLGAYAADNDRKQREAQAAAADLLTKQADKQKADAAREEAKRAAEQAKKDAEAAAKKAAADAKRAAEEAKRKQEQELKDFLQMMQNLAKAGETFENAIKSTTEKFLQARDQFVGSINKKTELTPGTSVTSLIRNATQRNALLAESQSGIQTLKTRGLSSDALKAIGITGSAEDARAIRKLLKASPEDLAKLSSSVSTLSDTAQQAAYREQGQIIGKEVRAALEEWAKTPGAQAPGLTVEQIVNLIAVSKATPENTAAQVASLGGQVKR